MSTMRQRDERDEEQKTRGRAQKIRTDGRSRPPVTVNLLNMTTNRSPVLRLFVLVIVLPFTGEAAVF